MVLPRYSEGTKVRIRTRSATGQVIYRELEQYENMTGVVLSSKAVVSYAVRLIMPDRTYTNPATTIHMYTVRLEEGITLYDLTEYCLEQI